MKLIELFDSPEKWTRNSLARTAEGEPISPYSDRATSFCVRGGAMKACKAASFYANMDAEARIVAVLRNKPDILRRGAIGKLDKSPSISLGGLTDDDLIVFWNNHPETTFEEFQSILKEAGV